MGGGILFRSHHTAVGQARTSVNGHVAVSGVPSRSLGLILTSPGSLDRHNIHGVTVSWRRCCRRRYYERRRHLSSSSSAPLPAGSYDYHNGTASKQRREGLAVVVDQLAPATNKNAEHGRLRLRPRGGIIPCNSPRWSLSLALPRSPALAWLLPPCPVVTPGLTLPHGSRGGETDSSSLSLAFYSITHAHRGAARDNHTCACRRLPLAALSSPPPDDLQPSSAPPPLPSFLLVSHGKLTAETHNDPPTLARALLMSRDLTSLARSLTRCSRAVLLPPLVCLFSQVVELTARDNKMLDRKKEGGAAFFGEAVIAEFEELTRDAAAVQRETLRRILAENAAAEYLQERGLAGRTDAASFRACVPLATHADVEPYIARIADGDTSAVLTAKPITSISLRSVSFSGLSVHLSIHYTCSSGTTQGKRKYLPFNQELVKAFPVEDGKALQFIYGSRQFTTKGGLTATTATTNVYRSEEFMPTMRAIASQVCSPDAVIFGPDFAQSLYCHLLCGLLFADEVRIVSATFAHSVVLAFQTFERVWEELVADIRSGDLSPTRVTSPAVRKAVMALLAGAGGPNPALADEVARRCAKLSNWYGVIPALFPNARYVHGIMTGSMEHYVKKLRHYAGGLPLVAAEYGASEGWVGANVEPETPPESVTFTVLPNIGYFEFIPLKAGDGGAAADTCYAEAEPVGLTEVTVGEHYEVFEEPTSGSTARAFTARIKNCRRPCRSWARRQSPMIQREKDTKILIDALDLLEEVRSLTKAEATLRRIAVQGLRSINSEKLAFWRQRFNLRMAIEWDENSRFFHAAANGRRRKSTIGVLDVEGVAHTSHSAKSDILFNFYSDLLGFQPDTECSFDLQELYPHLDVPGHELSTPFDPDEISNALFAMDMNASPGPDGLGPAFYKSFWQHLKPHVIDLFRDFHEGSLDLDGLNRAFLILLPKKEGARNPGDFRPISLQNCPMKLFTKAMANRVKKYIPTIVDADQTGFIQGHNISENFVYAADLLSCCHKRGAQTAVLKLDFKKAFDSVSWESLDLILAARGFDARWRLWVAKVLTSGKTAIKLNGVPGRWINCKRGLRQGDPISPYLFIIIADVLQRLIQQASRNGLLQHPLDLSLPCPVLQYADDILILIQGSAQAMGTLKSILDAFSMATGLTINYHKSTFVPMHIDDMLASEMASTLGCSISQFPQPYLGLRLSPHKLRVGDFQPLIANFDRYLSGNGNGRSFGPVKKMPWCKLPHHLGVDYT
ncbi:hypothetical protein HU200_014885 [Digitaria exilis]|uniref:Reverse transcriptase domain-containing protein n=1 Tax=Digitaria exilis TaxID=1010633 RepID=A0A835FBC7_9POAL|nr:hypothetical protein HU200_014885 [Digitaria exilis]